MSPKGLLGGNSVLALILHGFGKSWVKHRGGSGRRRMEDASHRTGMKPGAKTKTPSFYFECNNTVSVSLVFSCRTQTPYGIHLSIKKTCIFQNSSIWTLSGWGPQEDRSRQGWQTRSHSSNKQFMATDEFNQHVFELWEATAAPSGPTQTQGETCRSERPLIIRALVFSPQLVHSAWKGQHTSGSATQIQPSNGCYESRTPVSYFSFICSHTPFF